ncbi:hypothetical protein B0G75_10760 [Paraburkholderia sp. BL18I3N2]|nr:hypothetical protein B0G75_10760 [Paraburkholderia sp. BL18I3N2]
MKTTMLDGKSERYAHWLRGVPRLLPLDEAVAQTSVGWIG